MKQSVGLSRVRKRGGHPAGIVDLAQRKMHKTARLGKMLSQGRMGLCDANRISQQDDDGDDDDHDDDEDDDDEEEEEDDDDAGDGDDDDDGDGDDDEASERFWRPYFFVYH
jgi:cobalamin biosynthesis protein CobT